MTEHRRLVAWLLAATLMPIGALGWLGIRILAQERDIERQHRRERLEVAAGRLALDLDRRIQDVEERLARGAGVRFLPTSLQSSRDVRILYQPEASLENAAQPGILAAAEAAEFQRRDPGAAVAAYERLATSSDRAVRAAALVGLDRVRRLQHDRDGAIRAYRDLESFGALLVAGQPAGLVALQGRCKVFEESGDRDALRRAAADLAGALEAGGWPIDRPTFDVYRDLIEKWGGPAPRTDLVARTDAAIELWRAWGRHELAARGRRVIRSGGVPLLAVWLDGPERPAAAFATGGEIGSWLQSSGSGSRVTASIYDLDGQLLVGPAAPAGSISLTPGETRLPFVLRASFGNDASEASTRRLAVFGGLSAVFALMLSAAYGVYRVTTRELMLARQQSDFVSAVSHEFRTPLTSMRHLTELLASRAVTNEERRRRYYELIAAETERLHRMVESLLSFGRIEAGAYAWRLEPVDAADLVRGIVDDFQREPAARDRAIAFHAADDVPPIEADAEALSRAVWNLLENAVKYSEPSAPIRVGVAAEGESVLLSVADRGVGIPPDERERVFQKFVRGADAKRSGIRGVGIGLSLVKRIVEAHAGRVRLESQPGVGSTFTVVLPARLVD